MIVKIRVLLIALLLSTVAGAQEFRPWTFEFDVGAHWSEGDCSLDLQDHFTTVKGRARYNFTESFGLHISAQHSSLEYNNFGKVPFQRAAIGANANLFNIVGLQPSPVKVLVYGDVGYTRMTASGFNNAQRLFSTSISLTPILRISDDFSLKVEATSVLNHGKHLSYDFETEVTNTLLNSVSVGLMLHFGDGKPADWYVREHKIDTLYLKQREEVQIITEKCVPCEIKEKDIMEHVYFKHDVDMMDKDGLNAVQQIINAWQPGEQVVIVGYASNVGSQDYNLDLSKRRATGIRDRLIRLGVDANNIEMLYRGIDMSKGKADHDAARRVDLILKKG